MNTSIIKLTVTCALAALVSMPLYAQNVSYGVKAGADFSTWGGDDVRNADLDMNIGYHAGAFAEFPVAKSMSIESGLYLSRKGFKAQEQILGVEMDLTNTSTYLDLPVLAKFNVARNYNFFIGPQLSYILQNKITFEAMGQKDTEKSVTGFTKFDIGAVAGLGYRFANGMLFSANYDFGLQSLDDNTGTKAFNRVIKASIGYRIN
ncbi:MAG: porin family protein [Balneolaceae bacterium]|nr:porin family protein [Balneolaceae bacterium]